MSEVLINTKEGIAIELSRDSDQLDIKIGETWRLSIEPVEARILAKAIIEMTQTKGIEDEAPEMYSAIKEFLCANAGESASGEHLAWKRMKAIVARMEGKRAD